MDICKTEGEYIGKVAPAAVEACKKVGGYLPSVLIAQACHENGYGIPAYWDNPEIDKLMAANNMVGIKTDLLSGSWSDKTVWPGKSITKRTPEEYGGKMVTITDRFRVYDSVEQSFEDFLLFLRYASNIGRGGVPKYGPSVLAIRDPETLIRAVASRGYATGHTYPDAIMRIIRKHDLTRYDKEATTSMSIKKITVPKVVTSKEYNRGVPRRGNAQKYIVVHYLGVVGQSDALWNSGYGTHYVVYWDGTVHKVCDLDAITWQVGTAGGAYRQKHPEARNSNSIGIEMCCKNPDGYCPEDEHGMHHWYLTEETQEATVWLVSHLMDELGLDISHVLRHYDVVDKDCPAMYTDRYGNDHYRSNWTWSEFLANVRQYRKDGTITIPSTGSAAAPTVPAAPQARTYLMRGDRGDAVKAMQAALIAAGYSCGSAGADGIFGAGTESALKAYQRDHHLTADGKYGPKSKASLASAGSWHAVGTATATVDDLNVREQPTVKSRIVRKLAKGNRFEVDGQTRGGWIRVKVVDVIGWVFARYAKRD